jgi:hypothetical protein
MRNTKLPVLEDEDFPSKYIPCIRVIPSDNARRRTPCATSQGKVPYRAAAPGSLDGTGRCHPGRHNVSAPCPSRNMACIVGKSPSRRGKSNTEPCGCQAISQLPYRERSVTLGDNRGARRSYQSFGTLCDLPKAVQRPIRQASVPSSQFASLGGQMQSDGNMESAHSPLH